MNGDSDDDNLIEISNLAQLNAIRYDLNGDGMADTGVSRRDSVAYEKAFGVIRKSRVVCDASCLGYELTTSLDFRDKNGDGTTGDLSKWVDGGTGVTISGLTDTRLATYSRRPY